MSNRNSELANLLFLLLLLIGVWLVYSETSFAIGFILAIGALSGIILLARRENSLPLDYEEREAWENIRAKGRRMYILGSVRYGLLLGLGFLVYKLIRFSWSGEPFKLRSSFESIIPVIILYIGGSYYAAVRKWALYEERYRETAPSRAEHNNPFDRSRD